MGRMTGAFKLLVKKGIDTFRLCDSTVVFTKSFFVKFDKFVQHIAYYNFLVFQDKTYTRSIDYVKPV